jgi:hypothetical protein
VYADVWLAHETSLLCSTILSSRKLYTTCGEFAEHHTQSRCLKALTLDFGNNSTVANDAGEGEQTVMIRL